MATRSLTEVYILMRNNALQNRHIFSEQVSSNCHVFWQLQRVPDSDCRDWISVNKNEEKAVTDSLQYSLNNSFWYLCKAIV